MAIQAGGHRKECACDTFAQPPFEKHEVAGMGTRFRGPFVSVACFSKRPKPPNRLVQCKDSRTVELQSNHWTLACHDLNLLSGHRHADLVHAGLPLGTKMLSATCSHKRRLMWRRCVYGKLRYLFWFGGLIEPVSNGHLGMTSGPWAWGIEVLRRLTKLHKWQAFVGSQVPHNFSNNSYSEHWGRMGIGLAQTKRVRIHVFYVAMICEGRIICLVRFLTALVAPQIESISWGGYWIPSVGGSTIR